MSKNIYVICSIQIIDRIGNFVKYFLALLLSVNLNFDEKTTGFFITAVAISKVLGSLIAGNLGDTLGRKKVVIVFKILFTTSLLGCGFFANTLVVPYLLILCGFCNGAQRPIYDTMIIDVTNKKERKKAFSLFYFGVNIGVAVGTMTAGFLFKNHLEWIFWGNALASFLTVLLIWRFIPETGPFENKDKITIEQNQIHKAKPNNTFTLFLKQPFLLWFAIILLLSHFVYLQHTFTLPLQLKNIFDKDGPHLFGYLMSLNAVLVLILTTIILKLTKKIQTLFNLAISTLFYAVGFGILYYGNSFYLFILSTFLWTIGEIIFSTYYGVYVADHIPSSHRSRFMGIVHSIFGMSSILTPLFSGMLIDIYNIESVWLIVSFLSIFVTFFLYLRCFIENRTVLIR